ncbi:MULTISPECIES: NAD(+) synthase [unclassified Sedimentibacter]|uniref:NAD(+) synthase n=1 Tax=unclassified Sedimentibacter TaxID=2649220 RepID=UPI0027DF5560|nr:NAD(+) synthase [Sedimentibacter sp. MB35-C1]WMJ76251.1 NAD(+) synthase [Sedimentibacter sp. MB35-C1]
MDNFEYVRVASAVPIIKVADPMFNADEISSMILTASETKNAKVILFPELCITGYTCADLFNQKALIRGAEEALGMILKKTESLNILVSVGMPIRADNQLFNCAVVFKEGKILGAVPKTYVPNYNEFYEKRWFASSTARISDKIKLCGQEVSFSERLLFSDSLSSLCIGIDVCEDLWVNIPPSSYHTLYGANLILNLSASNETIGKPEYRREIVKVQSAKCITAYVYSSAGQTESTTDVVFPGHSMIAENGIILNENRFSPESNIIYSDIDLEKISNDRAKFNTYMNKSEKLAYQYVDFELGLSEIGELEREVNPMPFVPSNIDERNKRCQEIINIQATGLYQRLNKIGLKKAVVGISGGLDSTLALLVTVEAFKKLKLPMNNIVAITMPGFGTTSRTYNNALILMKELGVTMMEISIKEACIQHFKDIDHDMNVHNITYENSQARERTQILMDISNKENAIVVGTGDLSELALGWATYNGDHMSMYGVNASIPKTLVKYLVKWYAEEATCGEIQKALLDVVDTPVSPELLPPDKEGNIAQFTEKAVGSYDLNDFFLYNMLRNCYEPAKIYFLAKIAFKGKFTDETILETLKKFYRRFFTQQFKRSCLPDGVKVGSVSLSPRGDWRMPSDASYSLWMKQLEDLQ